MTGYEKRTQAGLQRLVEAFPRAGRTGYGVRPGTAIEVECTTPEGVLLVLRLPGWDHIDLFDDMSDDKYNLSVFVSWVECAGRDFLSVEDVARSVRRDHGCDAYKSAFAL